MSHKISTCWWSESILEKRSDQYLPIRVLEPRNYCQGDSVALKKEAKMLAGVGVMV